MTTSHRKHNNTKCTLKQREATKFFAIFLKIKGTSFLKNVLRDQNENFMDFVFKFFVDFIPGLEKIVVSDEQWDLTGLQTPSSVIALQLIMAHSL